MNEFLASMRPRLKAAENAYADGQIAFGCALQ